MIKIFEFKGKWYRRKNREYGRLKIEPIQEGEMLSLFKTIEDSFNEATLTNLDLIQQQYNQVNNG